MRRLRNISVGSKIFGLAFFMLVILVAVAMGNYHYMKKVNDEITDICEYISIVKSHIGTVNLYALEQDILFERILRLYKIEPPDMPKLNLEKGRLVKFGKLVDREIERAVKISEQAAMRSLIINDVMEFARLAPVLNMLEQDHQNFEEHILRTIELESQGNTERAQEINELLDEKKEIFDQRVHQLLVRVENFIQDSINQVELHERKLQQFNMVLTVFATITGLILATLVTLRLSRPLHNLIRSARAVVGGDLSMEAKPRTNDEIGKLGLSFNAMLKGVRQKRELEETFGQYLDPRIVDMLLKDSQEGVESSKQIVTVFFSDLSNFSSISETLTPARLASLINEYFTLATRPILNYQGVIDKFIGDAIVAFWGPPFVNANDQARLACRAALEQFTQLEKLQQGLPDIVGVRKGLPRLSVRVGLDTDESIVGNVGASHSKSFTVIGRAVETAERLECANKVYGTRILLTERTRKLAGDYIETRKVDWLPLGVKGEEVAINELLGVTGTVDPEIIELRDEFEKGLSAYREKDLVKARQRFESCLKINPNDGPSKYYLENIASQMG